MPVKLHRDVTAKLKVKVVAGGVARRRSQSQKSQTVTRATQARTSDFWLRTSYWYSFSPMRSHPAAQSRSREVRARRDPHQQPGVQPGRRGHRRAATSSAMRTGASSRRWSGSPTAASRSISSRSRTSSTRSGELDEVGGPAYISALTDGVPRSANVEYYAKIVKEKSTLRRLIQSATDVLVARLRRRGGRRRPARRGRAVDLPDRRAPPARRASCRVERARRLRLSAHRAAAGSTAGWSPACRAASSISTR